MKTINNKTFKHIPGYPGYYISQDGQLYSEKSDSFIKTNKGAGVVAYEVAKVFVGGKSVSLLIHKGIALAWKPLPQGYTLNQVLGNYMSHTLVVDHLDGNKLNNHASNLEWKTDYEYLNSNNYTKAKNYGNKNALGKRKHTGTTNRYTYNYDGTEYSLRDLCLKLNCSKSKITESFRRNIGLVKAGRLTRKVKSL